MTEDTRPMLLRAEDDLDLPKAGGGREGSPLSLRREGPCRHLEVTLPDPRTGRELCLLCSATQFWVICKSSHKTLTQRGWASVTPGCRVW